MTKPKPKSELKHGPKTAPRTEPKSEPKPEPIEPVAAKPEPITKWRDQVMSSLSVDTAGGKLRLKRPVNDVLHQIGYFFDDKQMTSGLKPNEQLAIAAAVIAQLREGLAA